MLFAKDNNTTTSIINADSSVYNGQLKNGKYHGKGILKWSDGRVYEGEFKNGLITGKGVFSQEIEYVYNKEAGKPFDLNQIIAVQNGFRYEGSFKNGLFHGQGTLYTPHAQYIGNFYKGNLNGKVKISNEKIDLSGTFRYGIPDGHFSVNEKDKGYRTLTFKNGVLDGKSFFYNDDGTMYALSEYLNGYPIRFIEYDERGEVVSCYYEHYSNDDRISLIETCVTRILEDSANADLYLFLGHLYTQGKEYDLALKNFTKVIELQPKLLEAHYQIGLVFYKIKKYDNAIERFTALINSDQAYFKARAYLMRGNAYCKLTKDNLALRDYEAAKEYESLVSRAEMNIGLQQRKKGQYAQAIEHYTRALENNPKQKSAYYNRGVAYEIRGDHDRAIENYTMAIGIDSDYAIAYYERADAYKKKGELEKARNDFIKAIELEPKYKRYKAVMRFIEANDPDKNNNATTEKSR